MSNKNAPKVQFNFVEEPEPGNFSDDELPQSDEEFDSYEAEQLSMPEVVDKPKPMRDDIFDVKIQEVVDEPVNEETGEVNPQFIYDDDEKKKVVKPKPVKPKVSDGKQKKPRKPMSEEHKAKLALAREKAMAVRKAKALEKKQMKEIEKETSNLRKKKKIKEFEQLKTEVNEEIPPKTVLGSGVKKETIQTFTKKDLEDAQLEAITKYETLRKARKEEKRKQQAIDKSKQDLMNKLKPQQPKYRDGSNRWDMCY